MRSGRAVDRSQARANGMQRHHVTVRWHRRISIRISRAQNLLCYQVQAACRENLKDGTRCTGNLGMHTCSKSGNLAMSGHRSTNWLTTTLPLSDSPSMAELEKVYFTDSRQITLMHVLHGKRYSLWSQDLPYNQRLSLLI